MNNGMRKNGRRAGVTLLVVGMLVVIGVSSAQATTRTVNTLTDVNNPNDGLLTLREAIAASIAGDTINFDPSLSGGAIDLDNSLGELGIGRDLTIVGPDGGITIYGNGSYLHRLLHIIAGTVSVSNCTISGGYERGAAGANGTFDSSGEAGSDGMGGGILNSGTLTLTNCTISGNVAYGGLGGNGYSSTASYSFGGNGGSAEGGGIYNEGTLTLVNSTLESNVTAGAASGFTYAVNGNSARSGSGGSGLGGGIYNKNGATLTLLSCTLSNSFAYGAPGAAGQKQAYGGFGGDGLGGGLSTSGTSTLTNCTFSGNGTRGGPGGAAGPQSSGFLTNGPGGGGYGGAIEGSGLTLTNCTISDNSATAGAAGGSDASAGYVRGGNLDAPGSTLLNTIIAHGTVSVGTTAGPDVYGGVTSQGHNLIGKTDDSSGWVASDLTGTAAAPLDPQLLALHSNGGPTQTRALSASSVAIDAGDDAVLSAPYSLTTDQRGLLRKLGAHVDIGAFEYDPPQSGPNFVVTTTDEHDDGTCGATDCTLLEALNAANANADANVITFQAGLSGTIMNSLTDNGLAVSHPVTINGPGARTLTISGGGTARIFNIAAGAGSVGISEVTLANGNANGTTFPDNCGGAILNAASLTLTDCTLSGNESTSHGGAIYNNGGSGQASLTLSNCTLSGNQSTQSGGAIFNAGYSGHAMVNATNCTFYQNNAAQYGGTIYNDGTVSGNAALTLTNCTLNRNTATLSVSGIYNDALNPNSTGIATLTLGNTILRAGDTNANLVNDSNGGGTIVSQGANISSDAAGGDGSTAPDGFLNHTGDKRNTDPELDVLANNGGQTNTCALLAGSPAIDAGDDTIAPGADQRGYPRVGVSDIGAFEFGSSLPTPTPTPTPIPPSTLGNISTRLSVQSGDNVLIGGFIITGTQDKKVIIRGLGPSLPLSDTLADPLLQLYSGQTLVEANDNWVDSPEKQAIINTGIPPSNNLESAMVVSLSANNSAYTAIVSGAGGATGIGQVEVYDLDSSVDSKLANISTRGFVQTGDNVMIGGFIVLGQANQTVLIRAIGPSLPVDNALADPSLELHDGDGALLESNDNWVDSPNKQAIIDTTIPPSNNLESAILRTVAPGNYTAIVRGVNDTVGVALVEVYRLQ